MIVSLLTRRKHKKQPAALPEGRRIYAVGDVHGRADLLDRLLSRIDAHMAAHPVARSACLFIGDYIDRGPGSRDVLNLLINCALKRETIFLRGNHDIMVSRFLQDPTTLSDWSRVGGLETLMSYGLKPSLNPDADAQKDLAKALNGALPDSHRRFLAGLRSSFTCGDYFFVHAGVRPGIPLARQSEEDLLWIRDEFLLHEDRFEKLVVHGHTPVHQIDIRPNRINIDTGAYATGRLSCLVMEGSRVEPLQS